MGEIKTKITKDSPTKYLAGIEDESKRKDGQQLFKIFQEITKEKGDLWSNQMIGFGLYHYKSERSSQEGDWPLSAFSVRKSKLTVYLMSGMKGQEKLLAKLGKHKVSGGSCLYITRLSNVDLDVLHELITASFKAMKEKYHG